MWMPSSAADLMCAQEELAELRPEPWRPGDGPLTVGGCFAAFEKGAGGPGAEGDPVWAAAVAMREGRVVDQAVVEGGAGAAYEPGLLFLRAGPVLFATLGELRARPDVLLVNATGRDHPRKAGLALHLGVVLELPTVGVTHRPLVAEGAWPSDETGAASPLMAGDQVVGHWLRTHAGARPLAVHAAWRTDAETALAVVRTVAGAGRTPEPLREARRLARAARAGDR